MITSFRFSYLIILVYKYSCQWRFWFTKYSRIIFVKLFQLERRVVLSDYSSSVRRNIGWIQPALPSWHLCIMSVIIRHSIIENLSIIRSDTGSILNSKFLATCLAKSGKHLNNVGTVKAERITTPSKLIVIVPLGGKTKMAHDLLRITLVTVLFSAPAFWIIKVDLVKFLIVFWNDKNCHEYIWSTISRRYFDIPV